MYQTLKNYTGALSDKEPSGYARDERNIYSPIASSDIYVRDMGKYIYGEEGNVYSRDPPPQEVPTADQITSNVKENFNVTIPKSEPKKWKVSFPNFFIVSALAVAVGLAISMTNSGLKDIFGLSRMSPLKSVGIGASILAVIGLLTFAVPEDSVTVEEK